MSYTHCRSDCFHCHPQPAPICIECEREFTPIWPNQTMCDPCDIKHWDAQRVMDDTDDCAVLDSVDRATDIREAMR